MEYNHIRVWIIEPSKLKETIEKIGGEHHKPDAKLTQLHVHHKPSVNYHTIYASLFNRHVDMHSAMASNDSIINELKSLLRLKPCADKLYYNMVICDKMLDSDDQFSYKYRDSDIIDVNIFKKSLARIANYVPPTPVKISVLAGEVKGFGDYSARYYEYPKPTVIFTTCTLEPELCLFYPEIDGEEIKSIISYEHSIYNKLNGGR